RGGAHARGGLHAPGQAGELGGRAGPGRAARRGRLAVAPAGGRRGPEDRVRPAPLDGVPARASAVVTEDVAALHDEEDVLEDVEIGERVAAHGDEVGERAGGELP